MSLIRSIQVNGFRSIASLKLDSLGKVSAFVGRNSSGKSNLLRALNLYFNDETDPGSILDFERDLHAPLRRSKRRKQITIALSFELPPHFKLHSSIGVAKDRLGSRFTITRTWRLNPQRQLVSEYKLVTEDGKSLSREGVVAPGILRLITFRYVPNRASPSDLLRVESPVLVKAIAKRLGKVSVDQFLSETAGAAAQLLLGTDRSLRLAGAPFQKLLMDTPADVGGLLRVTGFRAVDNSGANVTADAWGYGHQAFFLYHILKEADLDYAKSFGWRQATVWALEEPEAGLHKDLESSLAHLLLTWAGTERSRLQVLYSTHSATFAQRCASGFWLELRSGGTEGEPIPPNDLQIRAEREGVAYHLDPLLAFQDLPLVVVEGRTDSGVLARAAEILGLAEYRYMSPKSINPSNADGVEAIESMLERSQTARSARVQNAPVIVVVDWEVPIATTQRIKRAYGDRADVCVIQPESNDANPSLGPDFRGIERFYPLSIFHDAMSKDEIQIASHATKQWSVSPTQLRTAKGLLAARMMSESDPASFRFLKNVLSRISFAVKRSGDSHVGVLSDGTVWRSSRPFSKSERESRSVPILDLAWGTQDSQLLVLGTRGSACLVSFGALPIDQKRPVADIIDGFKDEGAAGVFSSDPRSTPEFAHPKPVLGDEYEEPYPHFVAMTNRGRGIRVSVWSFFEGEGGGARNYVKLDEDEAVVGVTKCYAEEYVGVATKHGYGVSFCAQELLLRSRACAPTPVIALEEGDSVHSIFIWGSEARAVPNKGPARNVPEPPAETKLGGKGAKVFDRDLLLVRRPLPQPRLEE